MKELTIEEKMEIGDKIAKIMGVPRAYGLKEGYVIGNCLITAMSVYNLFKKAADELREEGKI